MRKFCSEIYELYKSGKDAKRMRLTLNLLMKEISIGVYPKGLFGEAPELDVKALDGGLRMLKESDETITGYRIPSLRAVITIHLFDVITGSLNTSVCDECSEVYVSQKKRRENQKKYCSKKCKNKSTVRTYRAKRRNLDV